MNIFRHFQKKQDKENDKSEKSDFLLTKVFNEFRESTRQPTIKIKAYRGETKLTGSKFGGKPYFPKNLPFPVGETGEGKGQPLRLLAQLNFAEMPHLKNYPNQGLLQIFVFPDDLYGADFDDEMTQKNFKIFYHEHLDFPALEDIPQTDIDEEYMPFEGEFALKFEESKMSMTSSDFRFNQTFLNIYKKYFSTVATDYFTLYKDFGDEEPFENFYNSLFEEGRGHRIGGYAEFTQTDPREFTEDLKNHTLLLLEMDSLMADNSKNHADEIMWGDMGIGNFLIKPEDLLNHDFSKVAYNWDCG